MSLRILPLCIGASKRLSQSASITPLIVRPLTYDVSSSKHFDEDVMKCDKPVLVDFHAHWCGPCKILTPLLKKIIDAQFKDTVDLAMVNVDDVEDVAMDHDVRSIPTVLAVKDGKVVNQFVGSRDEPFLVDFITELLD